MIFGIRGSVLGTIKETHVVPFETNNKGARKKRDDAGPLRKSEGGQEAGGQEADFLPRFCPLRLTQQCSTKSCHRLCGIWTPNGRADVIGASAQQTG